MTEQELYKHIRENVKNEYSATIVVGALYKKIYGKYPKIGLSGQQEEFIDKLLKGLPLKSWGGVKMDDRDKAVLEIIKQYKKLSNEQT